MTQILRSLSSFLDGKKTYLGVLVGAGVYFANGMGWVDEATATTAYAVIGAWTGIAFRQAVKKAGA